MVGECPWLSLSSLNLFSLLLSYDRKLSAMWFCGSWWRDEKHWTAFIAFMPLVSCLFYCAFFVFYNHMKRPHNFPYVMSSLGQSWDYKEYLGVRHSVAFQGCFLGASGPSMVMPSIPLSMKPNQYFLKWNLRIPQGYYRECKVWPEVLTFLLLHGSLP